MKILLFSELQTNTRACRQPRHLKTFATTMVFGFLALCHPASALPVSLGTSQSFAILGSATVTNTGQTVVVGDLGVSPGTAITGFPPGIVVDGAMHSNDAQALQAQQDALAAYNILAGEMPSSLLDYSAIDLGGLTLTPGTYYFSSGAQLSGTLTLDHRSNPGGAFHFRIGSTLNTAVDAQVIMLGGSNNDVFWQVGSSATIGGGTEFTGNIIAHSSITFGTGASVINGRAFALNGAITLDHNSINAAAVPEPGNWIFGALLLGLAGTRTFARSLQVAGKA